MLGNRDKINQSHSSRSAWDPVAEMGNLADPDTGAMWAQVGRTEVALNPPPRQGEEELGGQAYTAKPPPTHHSSFSVSVCGELLQS